ncbi:hypothetical protein [Glycomyces xiaoerkulensis]|uniref:hypothetical protein n=1 Tax=Glycomyces xiaoerkulensis TaxID=2038139 RepID=UPI000C26A974|nr:hypothetical protein [Glycomyces xiaoerkulensis]
MAHGPSPFGVPQHRQRRAGEEPDWASRIDRAYDTTTAKRPGPDDLSRQAGEDDLETQLERIQASRPLRRAAYRARRRTRWWMIALAVVTGLAVVAACSAGAYIVLREGDGAPVAVPPSPETDEPQASAEEDPESAPEVVDPVEQRETDPEPLTASELFEDDSITPDGAAGAYQVLATDELEDCAEAALDALAELLSDADCTQAVRATVVGPDGEYAATAGVLNLGDAEEAEALRESIEDGLEGGFAAMRTEGDGAELGHAKTMLGYNAYGHFLMYAVIGRTDGEALEDADEPVLTVVNDLVDVWLVDRLSPRREVE